MKSMTMCRQKAVRDRRSKNQFCGERELSRHDAPLDQTPGPRRKLVARRGHNDRNQAQPAENLGPTGHDSLCAGRVSRAVSSPHGIRLRVRASPNSVDSRKLFTYRIARWSCVTAARVAEHRENACPKGKYEHILCEIQPSSVVTVGGTAVI
jgi:hypothetical protein